jgi:uncharacterized coiled-coil protein SlyX
MEQRIGKLEVSYMQQEQTIQELNDSVCRQEREIERLRRDFALLKEQLLQVAPSVTRKSMGSWKSMGSGLEI